MHAESHVAFHAWHCRHPHVVNFCEQAWREEGLHGTFVASLNAAVLGPPPLRHLSSIATAPFRSRHRAPPALHSHRILQPRQPGRGAGTCEGRPCTGRRADLAPPADHSCASRPRCFVPALPENCASRPGVCEGGHARGGARGARQVACLRRCRMVGIRSLPRLPFLHGRNRQTISSTAPGTSRCEGVGTAPPEGCGCVQGLNRSKHLKFLAMLLSISPIKCPLALQCADFNLSKYLEDSTASTSMAAMNPRWLSPEVMRGGRATQASGAATEGNGKRLAEGLVGCEQRCGL